MLYSSVGQLIRDAFIEAEVIAPEENLTQDGSQAVNLNTGLRLLNRLITTNNIVGNNIVLESTEQIVVPAGDNTLTLDGWSKIYKIRFLLGQVWFSIIEQNLNKFLNQATLPSSSGIPFIMYPQRTATGYLIRFFQTASQPYTFEIWGYKQLALFSSPSDPLTGFNQFYEVYYLYALAERLQSYYQIPHTPAVLKQVNLLEEQLADLKQTRFDVHLSQTSQAGSRRFGSIAAYNMSRGYEP